MDSPVQLPRLQYLGAVHILDPETNVPVVPVINVSEAPMETTGLATAARQEEQIAAINSLSAKFDSARPVEVQNPEMPLPLGAATATNQDSIITALSNLAALLGGTLNVAIDGEPLEVTVSSPTLPNGAATAANQNDIKTALNSVLTALAGVLEISGSVDIANAEPLEVTGNVTIDNTSLSVTPSGTFNVSVTGGATSAKQDSLIAILQDVLTRLQSPLAVTDNNTSLTVDGTVGISGPVAVSDDGGSLTVDGTVAATQSGPWNVGITGTPTVNIGNTVTVADADGGPLTVNGTVTVGNASIPVTDNGGSLTVDGTVNVGNASIPVTQSGTWTMNVNAAPSATATALTPYRNTALSSTPQQIKATAGRVYQYSFHNPNNAPVYIHFWNALAANVTAGTTVPAVTLGVPAGSVLDGYWSVSPTAFSTAITVGASTAATGTGAPNTGVLCQVGYV